MSETEYALRDVDLSGMPIGGFEDSFPPVPSFNLNRKGKFQTTINNGKVYVELTLFDARADVRLASDHWSTSDADITTTIDQITLSDRFNIANGQFENFDIELSGVDVDVDRGFPIGLLESISEVFEFMTGILFGEPTDFFDLVVKLSIRDQIRDFYINNVNPNAFIADNLDLLANYNLGLIDGIPAQQLLPIIADLLRNFETSAELQVQEPNDNPYRYGLIELTVPSAAINQAKAIYSSQN